MKKVLILNRKSWESKTMRESGYDFTKEELDEAEKLYIKFIGIKNNVECYLPKKF